MPCENCGKDVTIADCCHFELVNVRNENSFSDHPENIPASGWCSMNCFLAWVRSTHAG